MRVGLRNERLHAQAAVLNTLTPTLCAVCKPLRKTVLRRQTEVPRLPSPLSPHQQRPGTPAAAMTPPAPPSPRAQTPPAVEHARNTFLFFGSILLLCAAFSYHTEWYAIAFMEFVCGLVALLLSFV